MRQIGFKERIMRSVSEPGCVSAGSENPQLLPALYATVLAAYATGLAEACDNCRLIDRHSQFAEPHTDQKYQYATHDDLKDSGCQRRIHEAVTDPGDYAEFHQNHGNGDGGRHLVI